MKSGAQLTPLSHCVPPHPASARDMPTIKCLILSPKLKLAAQLNTAQSRLQLTPQFYPTSNSEDEIQWSSIFRISTPPTTQLGDPRLTRTFNSTAEQLLAISRDIYNLENGDVEQIA